MKIHYKKELPTGFYNILRKRVNESLSASETTKCYTPAIKGIILMMLYVYFFLLLLTLEMTTGIWLSYLILGILTTGIFLNVIHDAAHNALFKKSLYNNIALHLLELFGADSHIWKKRHIVSHHSYPNILNKDYDVRQSSLIRILPNSPFLAHHCYQPYYVPFVYLLYTLNWFFHRDFLDAFVHGAELHVSNSRRIKLVVHKIIYLFVFIVLPCTLCDGNIFIYIIGFILMHFASSLIGVLALTTAHVNHDSEFPEPDENGMMPDSWAMHQLRVTQDFATNNRLINSCFGGFNFHVAHHLFPSVQHRQYKMITSIIKDTAQEFGLEYKFKSLGNAMWSHYLLLINNSRKPIEIDM